MISVITATWNSERYLKDSICSVNQLPEPLIGEHIFIDGGSTDRTLKVIEKYSKNGTSKLIKQESKGLYEALNEAVREAKCDWIIFCHSDDVFLNLGVSKKLLEGKRDRVIFGEAQILDSRLNPIYSRRPPLFSRCMMRHFPFVFHPNAVYPRDLLLRYPYNPSHGRVADHMQLIAMGAECKFVRESRLVYGFRVNDGSTTVNSVKVEKMSESLLTQLLRIYTAVVFETRFLQRILNRLKGKRVWR